MVVLGVTNTSEACMFHESNNPIYGLTKNPYSLNHSAGGSSGGSAAACAAGAVPVAVASDVGGSIRIPSHFCGLFGHKPTGGTGASCARARVALASTHTRSSRSPDRA